MNTISLNRIKKDFEEIITSPSEGIGIVSLDNDPMKYIVNIKIMNGIFKGYCLQLLLIFDEKYPFQPPQILIYPGQYLDNICQQNILKTHLKDENDHYFKELYFDLLKNDISLLSSESYTGWNPSYTIKTLLLQVQTFLSNPDYPSGYIPSKEKIDELMKSMYNYEKTFVIKNENNENIIKIHTWKNPYPEMHFNNLIIKRNNNIKENINNYKSFKFNKIAEKLTCLISKQNYIDNKDILLGFLIKQLRNGNIIPIPEILSYDCYIKQFSKSNFNNIMPININEIFSPIYGMVNIVSNIINNNPLHDLFRERFILDLEIANNIYYSVHFNFGKKNESQNNKYYDSWLPIYINDENFERNKNIILNNLTYNQYINYESDNIDYLRHDGIKILLNILSEMLKKAIDKDISSSFLICFFQYVLMFKKLESKYNHEFDLYKNHYLNIDLDKVPQSWYKQMNMDIKKDSLELLILFLFNNNEINQITKTRIQSYMEKYKNFVFLELFKNKIIYDFIDIDLLIKDLKRFHLFDAIFSLINKELEYFFISKKERLIFNIIKGKFITKIRKDFIGFYNSLDLKLKQKINVILFYGLNFSDYVNKTELYNSQNLKFNVLDKSYEFISVFLFLREKIINERFMNELEENFGVCLEAEYLIDELKKIGDSLYMDKYNTLKEYNLFSIMELITLDSLYKNKCKEIDIYGALNIYKNKDNIAYKIFKNLMVEEKYIVKNKTKSIKKQIRINYKEKIKRDRIIIKNICNKTYNKRINRYTYNKKFK